MLVEITRLTQPVPITVFHLLDNLNMGNVDTLVLNAQEAYQQGACNLILDLEKTNFISSAGIGGIIMIAQKFNQEGRDQIETGSKKPVRERISRNDHFRICNCSPSIYNVFNIAGLVDVLGVYGTMQEAVKSF